MFRLSSLPIEILYLTAEFLPLQDLVTFCRLNSWYGYWFSIILGEKIKKCVKDEGWRIHVSLFFIFIFIHVYLFYLLFNRLMY